MRCDEIQEHMVDFIYDESDASSADAGIREHLRTCSACREELEGLKQTRKYLQLWKDAPPLRSVAIARQEALSHRKAGWKYLRYAAIAAMALICFLAVTNTQITWNANGFSYSSRIFASHDLKRDYYTKTEVRNFVNQALVESEIHTNENNYNMLVKMLDTLEKERWIYGAQNQQSN